jgi:hypothetical protein
MGIFTWIMDFFRGGEKPPTENETPEELTKREERQKAREERGAERAAKKQAVREYRIEKIHALKEKFYAVATKRKWLVFLIVAAIAAYLIIFKGGFGSGIMDSIKGLF